MADADLARWRAWTPERKTALLGKLWRRRYYTDPVAFVNDYVEWPEGERLKEHQAEILSSLYADPFVSLVSARGPHGIGKGATSALAIWHFCLTRDGEDFKVPTTASAWRQLEEYLWPEIHKWARVIRWGRLGLDAPDAQVLQNLSINLSTGSAFALASNDPVKIEGVHADHVLYVYDEAKGISEETFDASEGAFSNAGPETGREARALCFSTPGEPIGTFYDIHAGKVPGWKRIHVTKQQAVASGLMSESWAKRMAEKWGPTSSKYKRRILGEFAAEDLDSVVPLDWVEQAQERWRFWMRRLGVKRAGQGQEWDYSEMDWSLLPAFSCLGVDVADEGDDETVIAVRHGDLFLQLRVFATGDTMTTTSRINAALSKRRRHGSWVTIDSIGVGAGVVARMRELEREHLSNERVNVHAFVASARSTRMDRNGEYGFNNTRSEAWWTLREALDPAFGSELALPDDDDMLADLTTPKWFEVSGGKIGVESKDDIRKRLKRSTDRGDGVVQAAWHPVNYSAATAEDASILRIPR